MSPKSCSTAIAAILALSSAAPLMAQTTATEGEAAGDTQPATPAAPASPAEPAAPQTGDEAAGADATTNAAEPASDEPATTATPAQDDSAEDAGADAPAAASDGSAAGAEGEATAAPDAADAAAAPTEPQVGAYYAREQHGSWTLRCINSGTGADPCELYQLLQDGEGNSVAEITLIPLENGGQAVAGATLVSPLETDLTQGIGMRIDSGEVKGYPFNFCAPVGCVSRIGLTGGELDALKRGNAATISLLPYGATEEQVVNLSMSLAGFTAGYGALETAVTEMRAAAEAAQAEAANGGAATPAANGADAAAETPAPEGTAAEPQATDGAAADTGSGDAAAEETAPEAAPAQ